MAANRLTGELDPLGHGVLCPFRIGEDGDLVNGGGRGLVRSDLEQLVGMARGHVRWRPGLGTRLSRLRHRPNTGALAELARIELHAAVDRWEPRARITQVTTSGGGPAEKSTRRFDIHYAVGNAHDQVTVPG